MAVPVSTTIQTQIANLYIAILGRNPEPTGFGYWCETLANNNGSQAALNAIAVGFGNSPEFTATYGGQSTSAAITLMYNNVLNRAPDANGLSYWTTQYNTYLAQTGDVSAALALTGNGIITAAAANTGTADQTLILSKEATAIASGTAAPTTTYTLTTAPETITASNVTVNGIIDFTAQANSTLRAADNISPASGTNVLNITNTGAADATDATNGAIITGVQTINLRTVTAGTTSTLAATNTPVLTAVNAYLTAGITTVTALANGATAGVVGNGTLANGASNFGWVAAATAATINISGGTTAGAVSITSSPTTVIVNSTGVANTIGALTLSGAGTVTSATINAATNFTTTGIANTFTAATTDTLTINGAATLVTLGTAPATLDIINASGMTAGGISMTIGNLASTITGGAGNDTITTAGVLTGSVNAGGGTADRLVVAAAADVAATPGAKYTNFEILRNVGGGATLSVANVAGITSIELGATGQGATGMTAAQALAVTNLQDNATMTLALTTATGTSDVLTVNLTNATAATSASLTAATVTGFETMNVIANTGGVGQLNNLSFAAAANLTALNLSGAAPISLTTTNLTAAAGTAINASGITFAGTSTTRAFTVTGNLLKGSVVTGTNTVDSITTTAQVAGTAGDFVIYNGGTGNDAFSTTVAAINNTNAGFASVQINGGSGTDTLAFTENGLTLVDANFQYITGVETITYAVANQAISITTGGFFNTNFAGNTVTTLTLGDATNAQVNTVNVSSFTGATAITLTATAATTQAQSITGGNGVDTVTALVAGLTTGTLAISTGAGNDVIAVTSSAGALTTGTITLTGGLGQDTFSFTNGPTTVDQDKVSYVVATGDSTLSAADIVRNFALADGTTSSYVMDFAGTAAAQANIAGQAVTGYTAQELTYTIAAGLMTFAGTSAATLTAATKATIAQAYVTTQAASVVFTQTNSDATVDSWVFNNNTGGDSLVQLVGVTALGLAGGGGVTTGYVTVA